MNLNRFDKYFITEFTLDKDTEEKLTCLIGIYEDDYFNWECYSYHGDLLLAKGSMNMDGCLIDMEFDKEHLAILTNDEIDGVKNAVFKVELEKFFSNTIENMNKLKVKEYRPIF